MLLVTGPVSKHMAIALKRTYDATPDPKLVVAVGDCGCTGGIFGESYASLGRVANVIPVDVEIPGCPPHADRAAAGHSGRDHRVRATDAAHRAGPPRPATPGRSAGTRRTRPRTAVRKSAGDPLKPSAAAPTSSHTRRAFAANLMEKTK